MNQRFKTLLFVGLIFLAAKTYSQSITITPTITQQSNQFKSLAGQDRKADFMLLEPLFVTVAKTTTCSGSINTTLTSRTEVYNLLGTPDEILSPNLVAYYLTTNGQSCKALIGINNQNFIIFSNIENCP